MQLTYYMNHIPFHFENKALHSTVLNADVFIVVFPSECELFYIKI